MDNSTPKLTASMFMLHDQALDAIKSTLLKYPVNSFRSSCLELSTVEGAFNKESETLTPDFIKKTVKIPFEVDNETTDLYLLAISGYKNDISVYFIDEYGEEHDYELENLSLYELCYLADFVKTIN